MDKLRHISGKKLNTPRSHSPAAETKHDPFVRGSRETRMVVSLQLESLNM